MEKQVQNFKRCDNCSGVNWIDSKSDGGYKILGVTIPRDACSDCLEEGYEMYKKPKGKFTNTYLQDRVNDKYF